MIYRVFYDCGYCEGWYYEDFDSFNKALQFAEKQEESVIVGFNQVVPITYNIKLLY